VGRLVDDALVLGMIRERLGEARYPSRFHSRWFPTPTSPRLTRLERLLEALGQPLDAVVQFEVDYRELVRRISGRRTCAGLRAGVQYAHFPTGGPASLCPKTAAPHRLTAAPGRQTKRLWPNGCSVYDEKTRPLNRFSTARAACCA